MMLYITYALPFTIFMFSGTFYYLYLRSTIGLASLVLGVIACAFGFSVALAANPSLKALDASSYFLAMIVFAACFVARDSFKKNRILNALAGISYPLYAVHAISGYALMYVLIAKGIAPWLAAISAFILVIGLANILHRAIEQPTMRFGKQLGRKLFPKEFVEYE